MKLEIYAITVINAITAIILSMANFRARPPPSISIQVEILGILKNKWNLKNTKYNKFYYHDTELASTNKRLEATIKQLESELAEMSQTTAKDYCSALRLKKCVTSYTFCRTHWEGKRDARNRGI